jgi:hypothetical protein
VHDGQGVGAVDGDPAPSGCHYCCCWPRCLPLPLALVRVPNVAACARWHRRIRTRTFGALPVGEAHGWAAMGQHSVAPCWKRLLPALPAAPCSLWLLAVAVDIDPWEYCQEVAFTQTSNNTPGLQGCGQFSGSYAAVVWCGVQHDPLPRAGKHTRWWRGGIDPQCQEDRMTHADA